MRRSAWVLGLALAAGLGVSGCSRGEAPPMASARGGGGEPAPVPPPIAPAAPGAVASPSSLPKTSRKVIRNAELSIESATPAVAESKVSSLIERLGGYVAGAERLVTADEGQRSQATVKLSLRVPAERLDEALRDIKRLGGGAETEKISSEDVTDEYIDVEARISNQRHLEQQLVTILAQVTTVDNALKVHQELTAVRTEIDRLEGRKRFLDTESALAKISLSIAPLSPVVNASSTEFGVAVRRAASDSVAVAAGVVTFSIRAVGVLAPLGLLFGLPTAGVWFGLRRRTRKLASAAAA